MASSEREIELEEQLKEAGNRLLNPPPSTNELLNLLDKVEHLLVNVDQAPSRSMQNALLPSMKALISSDLLRHSDLDVKVSVASCISEVTRITAPDAPYNDEQMKEIFQLTVAAFENLSHVSSRCYMKAMSILDTVAKVRSSLVMLDLECDALIIDMFHHFLKKIRSNHPHAVFLAMESIMTLVIDESEGVSLNLLSPLLASVRKENQNISPMSWKLGEKVLANCSHKLKPYLIEAVQSTGITLGEFSPVVASICQNESNTVKHHNFIDSGERLLDEKRLAKGAVLSEPFQGTKGVSPDAVCRGEVFQAVDDNSKPVTSNGTAPTRNNDILRNTSSSKVLERCSFTGHSKCTDASGRAGPHNLVSAKAVKSEIDAETVPKKRGRKPNSLMNPEEGYDHSWIYTGKKTPKIPPGKKPQEKGIDCSPSENPVSKKAPLSLAQEEMTVPPGFSRKISEAIGVSSPSACNSFPVGGHSRRGRPKKKWSMMDHDTDSNPPLVTKREMLSAQVEKKATQYADVTVKIEPEDRSNSATKQRKRSRKDGHATKTTKETTQVSGYMVSEKDAEVPSDPEETALQQSIIKVEVRNIDKKRSSFHSDTKKRILDDATPNKVITKASGNKLISKSGTTLSSRDGGYIEETPEKDLKRKRTARKEVASEMPDCGEELLGRRIKVWWPLDKTFYEGVVDFYDHVKKKHRVLYADGDEEVLTLKRQRWELIGNDVSPEGEQETVRPKPVTLSDILEKEKGKENKESTQKTKADSSSRRSGASTRTTKVKSRKSGAKSGDGATRDNPIDIKEPIKKASKRDDSSEGEGQESAGKKLKGGFSVKMEHINEQREK